jgi:hypothetical protein
MLSSAGLHCDDLYSALQTVIDIATLTGAAGIALGQDTGALFANCDSLAQSLQAASRRAGEAAAAAVMHCSPPACQCITVVQQHSSRSHSEVSDE